MKIDDLDRERAVKWILESHLVSYELVRFFLGDLIGFGANRYVFECVMNPKLVVKIDFGSDFSNVIEWETWKSVMDIKGVKEWFAPVHNISPCGNIMTQSKCKEIPDGKYPKQIPRFFCDVKPSNFGLLNGKVVCFDYGMHYLLEKGMSPVMRKVNW